MNLRRFFLEPQGAELALEFSSTAVVGARVESKRGRSELRAVASAPLSEGSFTPSLEDPGFSNKEAMREAVKTVLSRIGSTPSARAALVVPDSLVRFRLFPQVDVAAEPKTRDAVIAFRMQKLLPFPPGETRVVSAWPKSQHDPVLGIGFSSSVLGAFERVGQAFDLDVGSVETSSMALRRGLQSPGDVLIVRHDTASLTLSLARDGWPLSIRSFDRSVARDRVEAGREIVSTAVFWRDRLQGQQLNAAYVHAIDGWFDTLSDAIETAFGRPAERAKPPSNLTIAGMPTAAERAATPALILLDAAS